MRSDLVAFFQAVSYAYDKWESYPEKDNAFFVDSFKNDHVPRIMEIWGLDHKAANEAVDDAIFSVKSRSVLAKKHSKSVVANLHFLSKRLK